MSLTVDVELMREYFEKKRKLEKEIKELEKQYIEKASPLKKGDRVVVRRYKNRYSTYDTFGIVHNIRARDTGFGYQAEILSDKGEPTGSYMEFNNNSDVDKSPE